MPTAKNVRPLLLLEINEVPWRVVDMALRSSGYPNVRAFFNSARTFTTVSHDEGELSPWITWPSLHRGLRNTDHGIQNLGQDISTFNGVPIWREYLDRGHSVGVCGSMQSWPPVEPGKGGFYLPDTFAHDEQCIPRYLEPLQRFNLSMVRKNGLVARDTGVLSREFLELIPSLGRAKIRPKTFARVAKQLVEERREKHKTARRAIFQSVLFWDVFRGLYDEKNPPAFASYFTNHVAGVMHRYWDQIFPEDFGGKTQGVQMDTMRFALSVTDEILGDALAMARRNPDLMLVFATSMGQAAVHRQHEGFCAQVLDLIKLLSAFGLREGAFKPLLAMVPQVAAEIEDESARKGLLDAFARTHTASGAPLFVAEEVGKSVSISILTPSKADIERGGFQVAGNHWSSWQEAGVSMTQMAPGTGYHIPEGVMAIVGEGVEASDRRTRIAATDVKAHLMGLAGLSASFEPQVLRDDARAQVGIEPQVGA